MAKLTFSNDTLRDSISAAAIPLCSEYNGTALAGTLWACAALCYVNLPLLNALSSEALTRLSEFTEQSLANTAWALSNL